MPASVCFNHPLPAQLDGASRVADSDWEASASCPCVNVVWCSPTSSSGRQFIYSTLHHHHHRLCRNNQLLSLSCDNNNNCYYYYALYLFFFPSIYVCFSLSLFAKQQHWYFDCFLWLGAMIVQLRKNLTYWLTFELIALHSWQLKRQEMRRAYY